ncbi:MAG: hypothetical protein WA906_09435 [Pacificimonas sp.]
MNFDEGKPAIRTAAITLAALATLALAACSSGGADGDAEPSRAFSAIPPDEVVTAGGTEPFWSIEIEPRNGSPVASYTTPSTEETGIAVERFAGLNGVSWTGTLGGQPFAVMATLGPCSDGMSDRVYPYDALVEVRGETLSGCIHTDRQGFTGTEMP